MVFPRLRLSDNEERNEEYYQQQVLLHVPWRTEEGVLGDHATWKAAYEAYDVPTRIQGVGAPGAALPDAEDEDDGYEELEEEDDDVVDEWMVAARHMPGQELEQVEAGRREMDLQHDWAASSQQYGEHATLCRFLKAAKEQHVPELADPEPPQVDFTPAQQNVLDILELQIAAERNPGGPEPPRRVIVQGKAGCGKSTAIQAMTSRVHREFGRGSYLLLAPTGAAADNIKASTIHRGLCIPPQVGARNMYFKMTEHIT